MTPQEKGIAYEKEWAENKAAIYKFLKSKCEASAAVIKEYLVANYRIERLDAKGENMSEEEADAYAKELEDSNEALAKECQEKRAKISSLERENLGMKRVSEEHIQLSLERRLRIEALEEALRLAVEALKTCKWLNAINGGGPTCDFQLAQTALAKIKELQGGKD